MSRISPRIVASIKSALTRGESMGAIASRHQISKSTVHAIATRHGLTGLAVRTSTASEVLILRRRGLPMATIAAQLGISTATAYRYERTAR